MKILSLLFICGFLISAMCFILEKIINKNKGVFTSIGIISLIISFGSFFTVISISDSNSVDLSKSLNSVRVIGSKYDFGTHKYKIIISKKEEKNVLVSELSNSKIQDYSTVTIDCEELTMDQCSEEIKKNQSNL